jgi:anti-sigma factor RsiW
MTQGPREIFDCARVADYLESYLQGQVPPPERRGMRLHIHGCPHCLEKALARDPLQLFAPLSDEEKGEEFWTGFWPAIRADIHASREEPPSFLGWLRRPVVAWSAAAAMLLLAAAVVIRGGRHSVAPATEAQAVERVPADLWRGILPASDGTGERLPAIVEDVKSPTAKVLSMKVYGGDQAVTEVVLIVDEALDL